MGPQHKKKLKSVTVEAYLSAIDLKHKLMGFQNFEKSNQIIKLLLKGSENLEIYSSKQKTNRNVMTLPLLKILGHEIANKNWSSFEKQLIWTVSCLPFFGSFRIGELLCNNDKCYDPFSSLVWGNINVTKDSIIFHIQSPKSKNKNGDFVDIFGFKGHNCCPQKSFLKYQAMCKEKKNNIKSSPVFKHENGVILTKQQFNKTIQELMTTHMAKLDIKVTGHSFRAGIPSVLAKYPEIVTNSHIMGWGRWDSGAFLKYTRLKSDQKRKIFEKIVSVLNVEINK